MQDSVRISREQIDKTTFAIASLDAKQRHAVREVLYRLHDKTDGILYRESCHRELVKLWESGAISEGEFHAVESAMFSG